MSPLLLIRVALGAGVLLAAGAFLDAFGGLDSSALIAGAVLFGSGVIAQAFLASSPPPPRSQAVSMQSGGK